MWGIISHPIDQAVFRHDIQRMSAESGLDFLRRFPFSHGHCSRRFSGKTRSQHRDLRSVQTFAVTVLLPLSPPVSQAQESPLISSHQILDIL
ncbi:unnamed protein product [Pleuronectes platessa]|uniref:Uncharacterized protein n=1 Tax=Pleuronectes platessa TaxID=8262 RepID=A0A9N7ZA32_PLEPL|nr:unnamed protein product [Pleuronectes platessa]